MSSSSDRRSSCAMDDGSAGRAFGLLESRLYSPELTNPHESGQVYNQTAIQCIFHRGWYKIRTKLAFNHTDVFPVQPTSNLKWGKDYAVYVVSVPQFRRIFCRDDDPFQRFGEY